jgi:hypothetical protein
MEEIRNEYNIIENLKRQYNLADHGNNIPMCMSDYRRGLDWYWDILNTLKIVNTSNYTAVANSHILQFTTAHTKTSASVASSVVA